MMEWDELKPMFRPEGVHMGVLKIDADKCNHCGVCIKCCPFDAWEEGADKVPHLKNGYYCFSCSNCLAACPKKAITLIEPYHVVSGFFKASPVDDKYRMPIRPCNADGKEDEWNDVEKLILERRSVRNFKEKPVPETVLLRVLEAGRYAPSAANAQPWKFIAITNTQLIHKLDEALMNILGPIHDAYMDDKKVSELKPVHEAIMVPGMWDPRIVNGGMRSFSRGTKPPLLKAPAVIIICGDKRAPSGPQINLGICGQNMALAAASLGLGACWIGWTGLLNGNEEIMRILGIEGNWEIGPSIVLGYPKFKQQGLVTREYRPVTWFREGASISSQED